VYNKIGNQTSESILSSSYPQSNLLGSMYESLKVNGKVKHSNGQQIIQ